MQFGCGECRRLVLALATAVSFTAAPCRAQSGEDAARSAGRQLGYEGVAAYQASDFAGASAKLEKAYRVLRVPSIGLWSGRALRETGKWVEAAERFREVGRLDATTGDVALQERSKKEAQAELSELSPKIPAIVVQVIGAPAAEVRLAVDGSPIASDLIGERLFANPGTHHVKGTRGREEASADVTLSAKESKTVSLRFEGAPLPSADAAAPPPVSSAPAPAEKDRDASGGPLETAGFIMLGVGGAGLIVGTIAAVLLYDKKSDLDGSEACSGTMCAPSESDRVDSYNTLRVVSSAGFIAGGVLAAGGLTLVLMAPPAAKTGVGVSLGPTAIHVSGRF